jgi:hypothetical protein
MLFDEMNAIAATVNQIESVRAQLVTLRKELGTDESSKPILKSMDDLEKKIAGIEGSMLQLKLTGRGQDDCRWAPMLLQKVDYLFNQLNSSADFPPTTQQIAVQEELSQRGNKAEADFHQLLTEDLAAFNAMLHEHKIGNIYLKTP